MSKVIIQKIKKEPVVRFNGNLIFLPTKLQREINKYWKKCLDSGKEYFNGELYMVTQIKETSQNSEIIVQKTNFAHWLYARNTINDLGKYNLVTVFSSGLVITKDNKIVFGKMGEQASTARKYQLSGGGLNDDDLQEDIFDMKYSIERELIEELGLNINDKSRVQGCEVAYLKTGGNGNVAIIYEIKLNETAEEFLKKYNDFAEKLKEKNETPEFSEIVILPNEKIEIEKFINQNKDKMANYLPGVLRQVM